MVDKPQQWNISNSFLVMTAAAGLDDATVILSVRASDSGERFQDSVIRLITVYYREPAPITFVYTDSGNSVARLLVSGRRSVTTDTTLSVARLLVSGGRVFADGTYQLSLINRQNAPTGEDAFINDDNVVIVNAPLAGFLTLTAQAQDEHPAAPKRGYYPMQIALFVLRQSQLGGVSWHCGRRVVCHNAPLAINKPMLIVNNQTPDTLFVRIYRFCAKNRHNHRAHELRQSKTAIGRH